MTLVPIAKPGPHQQRPPVDPVLLETDAGIMVEGRHEWREYHTKCAAPALSADPNRQYRTISLYEILTSWRKYTCYACRQPLWAPENQATK